MSESKEKSNLPSLKQGLENEQIKKLLLDLEGGWSVKEGHLEKFYSFDAYLKGLDFVKTLAKFAQSLGHHPDISLSYKGVKIVLFTHRIKGLSKKDFEFAAKVDVLYTSAVQ